jgi:thioredoxin-related protein
MMKRILVSTAILSLLIFGKSFAQQAEPKSEIHKFDPGRNPFEDVNAAVKEAQSSSKRIILDVGGEWCIWCHRLDKFINENEEIKKTMDDNFIVVKVNVSKENKNEKFLAQFPAIPGYPHLFVLEKDGKLLHSQDTGKLEKDKSYDVGLLMAFLKKWSVNN